MFAIGSNISGDLAEMRGFFNPKVSLRIRAELCPNFIRISSGVSLYRIR
jgi:hypothetical protein